MFTTRKLVAALGIAGMAAAGAANAAGLVAAGNAFHISGSTALDNQIKAALLLGTTTAGGTVPAAQTTCQAGTISVYTDAPPLAGGNLTKAHQTTVVCNLNNAIGTLPVGTTVAFTKESNGGSNEGTFFVAAQQGLNFFDATQAPVGCTNEGAIAASHYFTHQQAIATEFDGCTGPIVSIVPEVGVADEDPALFNLGLQAISSSLIAKLNTTPLFQNQFGVGVSLDLYRALQTQQGLTVGDDTLANMPSLSRAQIAGLFSGAITNWSQIVSSTGSPLTAGTVFTCRRGDNSGTNVSADAYFLHNRCATTGTPMVTVTTTSCAGLPTGQTAENNGCTWNSTNNINDVTFGGASTGDVVSCLDAHSRNGTFAYGPVGTTSKFDDPNGATGAATEAGTAHFRFIAIDGNKPTVESMANGTYDYAFDNVENVFTGASGNPLAVGTYLGTLFQNVTALSDILVTQPNALSSGTGHPADTNYITGGVQDGLTGTPNTPPVSATTIKSNPTSDFTLAAGGTVNNCQVPLTVGNSVSKEVF
jgi:PBP superfamily domain